MATKYVDFGRNGTGHAGTEADPLGAADFLAETFTDNTYKCRGWLVLSGGFSVTVACALEAWDVSRYGPWRIYGGSSYTFNLPNGSVSDGIIDALVVRIGGSSTSLNPCKNMVIKTNGTASTLTSIGLTYDVSLFLGKDSAVSFFENFSIMSFGDILVDIVGTVRLSRSTIRFDNPSTDTIAVDAGGNIFVDSCATNKSTGFGTNPLSGMEFFEPWTSFDWTDAKLTNYADLPGFGVGAHGGWAERMYAAFSASVRSGVGPLAVDFTDLSTGNPASWLWDFGDGTTSTDQNPSHTYSSVGSPAQYKVTLTVTSDEDGEPPAWLNDGYYYQEDEYSDDTVSTWFNTDFQDNVTIDTRSDGKKVAVVGNVGSTVDLFPDSATLGDQTNAEFWWRINFGDLSGPDVTLKVVFCDTLSGTDYFSIEYDTGYELRWDYYVDCGQGSTAYTDSAPPAASANGYIDLKLVFTAGVGRLYWSSDGGDTWTQFDDGTGDNRECALATGGMATISAKVEGASELGFEFFRFQSDDDPDEGTGFPDRYVSSSASASGYIAINPQYQFPLRGYAYDDNRVAYHYGTPNNPEQGYGWSEIRDGAWVWPDSPASLVSLNDADGYRLAISACSKDGLFWLINTRNGPSSTTLVKRFVDKFDPAVSSSGTEIPVTIKWPEWYGSKEHFVMQHLETHLHIRPDSQDNVDADGYGSSGLRAGQSITFNIYKNGEESESARALTIPEGRELVFTRHVRGAPLQLGVVTVTSEFKIGRIESYFTVYNKAKYPAQNSNNNTLASTDHDDTLSRVIFWIARGEDMGRERRTQRVVGQVDSKVTGPDGKTSSGGIFES